MPKQKLLPPMPTRICRTCNEPFILGFNKPGHVDDCRECAIEHVTTYKAKVAYPSKNSCLAEFEFTKNHAEADAFNKAQVRRGGSGVTASCVTVKGHI